jgi:hypothetical protein
MFRLVLEQWLQVPELLECHGYSKMNIELSIHEFPYHQLLSNLLILKDLRLQPDSNHRTAISSSQALIWINRRQNARGSIVAANADM